VLFAVALAANAGRSIPVALAAALLAICILMQATANTLNDYYDFKKGADSLENQEDPTDAVLVYNRVDPASALRLAIGFLIAAALLGAYVVARTGWVPLAIGIIGAGVIVLYSAGKTPLSYLPLGEAVSGIAMGTLIPLACYYALTSHFVYYVVPCSLPLVIGIALIMFTNNTCDIEKDIEAGRRTLPVILGRERSRSAYHAVLIAWVVALTILAACFFTTGLLLVPFMLLILYPALRALWDNPLTLEARTPAMSLCLTANIGLGAFYVAIILFSTSARLALF
jgi:1,4-dihydroxy-2-naphthoate octaprenyltransferase